jgi:hypothetical protein
VAKPRELVALDRTLSIGALTRIALDLSDSIAVRRSRGLELLGEFGNCSARACELDDLVAKFAGTAVYS